MKTFFFILISSFILLISCQSDESKINEFKDIYFDILMIRETYMDTAVANPKVRMILKKYGYDDESFKNYSMELFTKNPQAFTAVIDSVRLKAEKKLMDFGKERTRKQDSIRNVENTKK